MISSHLAIGSPATLAYLARGQSRADWPLKPSLQRCVGSTPSVMQVLQLEEDALNDFVSQALLHLRPDFLGSPQNRSQLWAIMQHHGAPTRLLDWTSVNLCRSILRR